MNGVYKMSESGGCPKALAAARLGYEPAPRRGGGGEVVMREGKRHEAHIAEDLVKMGYELEDAGECLRCREEFGETGIGGYHVEINTFLIRLIGHIDRYLVIDGQRFPCEFKSMSTFIYPKFRKEGLSAFPAYGSQEACYIGYMERPGLYVVKNRDNGEMLIYTVPYSDSVIPGHAVLPITITLDQVVDKLHMVEISVRDSELPECGVPVEERRWCDYRYLCTDPEVEEKGDLPEATDEELKEAASLWREGKDLERESEGKLEYAKQVFILAGNTTPKFKVGGVSVTYAGLKSRKYLDEKVLRELVEPNILKRAQKETKPYDDIRIRLLEEQNTSP